MTTHPVLIGGRWRPAAGSTDTFHAFDPRTGTALEDIYPVSARADLEEAAQAGAAAAEALEETGSETIASFLRAYADRIEASSEEIARTAALETALPYEPRLHNVELPRTTGQLRQAADACEEGSWRLATIDTGAGIRSMHEPLGGPVFVLGPNNFPLAFNGISGGDFAAAIAAGNPVIAKAHPAHPTTSRLLAETAHEAAEEAGLPEATVQMIYRCKAEDGVALVADPRVAAVAFTGGRAGGLALKKAADEAGKPVYLEMSSTNPVFILPGALAERSADVAEVLVGSCLMGAGQFCTSPGIFAMIGGAEAEAFIDDLAGRLKKAPAGVQLTRSGPTSAAAAARALQDHGAELLVGGIPEPGEGFRFQNTLLRVSAARFLEVPAALQTEVFGTAALAVVAENEDELLRVARALEGNLTGCIFSATNGRDDALYTRLEPPLRRRVGRILNDKPPTGVAVSPAMVHGGPFPATGHPGFTAVGIPASLRRFSAVRCYDAVRPERLPPELRDAAPSAGMWRLIDGAWKRGAVG